MNNFDRQWNHVNSDFDKHFNTMKRVAIAGWLFGVVVVTSVVGTGIYLLLKHFG